MDDKKTSKPSLVIVTGLSGAGKSIAINALEDLSYYCIDNLPLDLVENAVSFFLSSKKSIFNLALGLDVRTSNFVEKFIALQKALAAKIDTSVVFLTATDEVIAKRFSTTRRKHPMQDQSGELIAAIRRETNSLSPIERLAQLVFDTSAWSPHQLTRQIESHFSSGAAERHLFVTVTSFGFKHGVIKPADTMFDVRFLKNPHFDPALQPKTGLDSVVRDYVFSDPNSKAFADKIIDLHKFLLPCYYSEGKHYFRIGIGCTGGQHRSVALAEHIGYGLSELNLSNMYITVNHRDVYGRT